MSRSFKASRRWSIFALILLAVAALAAGATPGVAAPARQSEDENEVGTIETLALDSTGNGWAWAEAAPQRPGTNYLLRIKDGKPSIAADTTTNPTLLPSGLTMIKMVLNAKGDDGWAVGRTVERYPLFWRYQNGAWKIVKVEVPADARIARSLTINAAGTDGWLTLYDQLNDKVVLFRLNSGAWKTAAQPKGGMVEFAAISSDGKTGWGAGRYGSDDKQAIFRLANGVWVATPVETFPAPHVITDVAADNTGFGWAIDSTGLQSSVLLRLNPDGFVSTGYRSPDKVKLDALAVDAMGRGWALGAKDLGQVEQPGGFEYLREAVVLYLDADTASVLTAPEAAFAPSDVQPRSVALTPDGGQAWAGAYNKVGFGRLINFREPWLYATRDEAKGPAGLAPLPGRGRCFAEVAYCLRGVFLDFWEKNGGLDQLGLPITTEVNEKIGGKDYLVQYTQRARLEYHPENQGKASVVLLGLLGNTLADPRQNEAPFTPRPAPANPIAGTDWFSATRHNVGAPFLAYWQAKGGLPVFGYPRSEAFEEPNQADGKTYLVQYFERNRIEYHPENKGTKFEFLLGLLGVEQFNATYGFTP